MIRSATQSFIVSAAAAAGLCAAPVSASAGEIAVLNSTSVAFDNFSLATSLASLPAEDTILIVGFTSMSENFVDIVPTTLTFGGQPLTRAGGIVQNAFTDWYARTDIYYLLNPPAGTQPLSGSVNAARASGFRQESVWGMHAIMLSGAAQEAPVVQFTRAQNPNAPSSNLGGSVNVGRDGSMLVGFAAMNNGASGNRFFSNDGVTDFVDAGNNIMTYAGGYKPAPLAGTTPFTWVTNAFATGVGAVAIAEVYAAGDDVLLGDLDGNGAVTHADIQPFVQALTDPAAFALAYPGIDPDVLGDFDGNGDLTNGDIAGFINALGVDVSAIPEPSSLTLLGLGGLLVARRRR